MRGSRSCEITIEQLMRGSRSCEITMLKSSSVGLIMPFAKYFMYMILNCLSLQHNQQIVALHWVANNLDWLI
jgi:hypothetical protein